MHRFRQVVLSFPGEPVAVFNEAGERGLPRVEIEAAGAIAHLEQRGGQMYGGGRLSGTALFVSDDDDMGVKPGQLALAWVLRRSEVSSAIVGATKVSQLEENVAAVEISIPEDVLAKLDEIYPPMVETYPG